MFSLFYALTVASQFTEAFFSPVLATEAPKVVEGILAIINAQQSAADGRGLGNQSGRGRMGHPQ